MALRTYLIPFLLIGVLLQSCGEQGEKPNYAQSEVKIAEIMHNQQNAWNDGDLVSFMNGYWESDSLVFLGKSGVNNGWQKTLENYQMSYPNIEAMGQLQFSNLSYKPLGHMHYLVIGKWYLTRDSLEDLSGHYSLIWEKINGKWVIITDHSS
jgi:ketosteroid isomerase-like protein